MKSVVKFAVTLGAVLALAGCSKETATGPTIPENGPKSTVSAAKVQMDNFAEGNLALATYHGLAHALISEYKLPIKGSEEEMADSLAIWMLTPNSGSEEIEYLWDTLYGWLLPQDQTPLKDNPWWTSHGFATNRGARLACLLYGANPKRYKTLIDTADWSEETRLGCEDDSGANEEGWVAALAPHSFAQNDSSKSAEIKRVYEQAPKFAAEEAYLKDLASLADIAEGARQAFKIAPGMTMAAKSCGKQDAFWDAKSRSVVICYEYVAALRKLAEPPPVGAPPVKG